MVDVSESLRCHFGHASFRLGQETVVRAIGTGSATCRLRLASAVGPLLIG